MRGRIPAFDDIYHGLRGAGHASWRGHIDELQNAPHTLAIMRWHWKESTMLQLAMTHYLASMKACVACPMVEEEVRLRPFHSFYRSAVEQFASKLERVRGTPLRDAAESSREVMQNEKLLLAAVAWLSATPEMERFARLTMEACAKQFRAAGHVVVLPDDEM